MLVGVSENNAPEDKSVYFRHGGLWHQLCTQRHNDESTVRHQNDRITLTSKVASLVGILGSVNIALFVFNLMTFSICMLLRKVPVDLGFALGLFAVFGILRYRTEPVRIKDLTYMFIVIGLGIVNGIANKKISGAELLTVNALISCTAVFIELIPTDKRERSIPMLYDNLALLAPGKQTELVADLTTRTGLVVKRVELVRYDLVRDSAELMIIYEQQANQPEDSVERPK